MDEVEVTVVELDQRLIDKARKLLAEADLDAALSFLRGEGVSQILSIAIVMRATTMSVHEAKLAVHNSPVWADRKAEQARAIDELIDSADRAFKDHR